MTVNELIAEMKDGRLPRGICIRYEWQWDLRGELCTRAAKTLIKRNLASAMYFTGGHAALNLTDEGKGKV